MKKRTKKIIGLVNLSPTAHDPSRSRAEVHRDQSRSLFRLYEIIGTANALGVVPTVRVENDHENDVWFILEVDA